MDYYNQSVQVSYVLSKVLPFVLLGVLGFNLVQMLFKSGWNRKRFATFYMTCLVGALCVISILFVKYGINDLVLIPLWIVAIVIPIVRRKDFFPFSIKCASCGKPLSLRRILFVEPSLCPDCESKEAEKKDAAT